MFEETIGKIGYWALVIAFLFGCWRRPEIRLFGYAVGFFVLIIALVRQFITMSAIDNGGYFATGLVILGVCYLGRLKERGILK